MSSSRLDRLRIGPTISVAVAIWSQLVWRHFHGGVPAHHLLDNPDLPRISDWFGGLLPPVLCWWLPGLARRRVKAADSDGLKPVIVGFAAAIVFGIAMSVSFVSGHEAVTSTPFVGLLPLALLLPVHRPECLLGFVPGMSVAFGAVLPTLFGSIMALATFAVHRLIGLRLQRLAGLRGSGSR